MMCAQRVRLVSFSLILAACAAPVAAEDISGTLNVTKLIVDDSRLVGDVTCTMTTTPCIQFGAPNITLRLQGHTITGTANPDETATCNTTSGPVFTDGISNGTTPPTSQPGVSIIGPGMVQKFRRHGIFIVGVPGVSTHVVVKHVTSNHHCFSGLMVNSMSDSIIDGVVSVRNAANSGTAPCGGSCVVNSTNNRIVNSLFGGNGSVCAAAFCAAVPTVGSNNDFGLGLIGASSGNVIEHNSMSGNSNGILIQAPASGNTIRDNIVAGNPPSQLSRSYGPIGFDIKDEAVANGARNTFDGNWCITYAGPGPAPCPGFPAVVPPTISALTATPNVLWPANRKSIEVSVAVTVSDDSDPAPVCEVTDVSANEPLEDSDSSLTGPLSLTLRAERNGLGVGRVYSITVTCTNASHRSATASVPVVVPHDQR